MAQKEGMRILIFGVIAIVIALALFSVIDANYNDNDSPLENAAQSVSEGFEDAGRDLDPNRTVGEKAADALDDAGDAVDDAVH